MHFYTWAKTRMFIFVEGQHCARMWLWGHGGSVGAWSPGAGWSAWSRGGDVVPGLERDEGGGIWGERAGLSLPPHSLVSLSRPNNQNNSVNDVFI